MAGNSDFELTRVLKFIEEQCEKSQSQLGSVVPDDVHVHIHMNQNPEEKMNIIISFDLNWPKLKDQKMQHTNITTEMLCEDLEMLIEIGGELEIKETLTFTFAPYLQKLREFVNEYA